MPNLKTRRRNTVAGVRKTCWDGQHYKSLVSFQSWRVAMINHGVRFSHLDYIERHLETDEVFVLLKGRAELVIGKRLRRLPLAANEVVTVRKGVWHQILTSPGTKVLVVENNDTSAENSERIWLNKEKGGAIIMTRKNIRRCLTAGAFGLAVLAAMHAHAAGTSGTWQGGVSGNWSGTANWSGSVPGGGGDATIRSSGSDIVINNDVAGLTLGGLYMPKSAGLGGSLTVSGGPISFVSKEKGNNVAARFQLNLNSDVILESGSYPHVVSGLCTFNGVVSGAGVLKLASDSPVVRMYAANTYTGGTVVPSGSLYVHHVNGLGANAEGNAASVTVEAGAEAVFFAVADGVFYHPIVSTFTTAGGAGTSMVNVRATENTTLKGKLSGGAFGFCNAAGKKLIVDGEVDCGAYGLYLYPVGNGNIVVNGKVTASVIGSSSGVNNADTQFVLANPENAIGRISLQTRSFRAGAANVCTGSVWESTQAIKTKALWFLNGFDQSIDRILTDSFSEAAGLFVYSGDSSASTSKAATLTMKATADANLSYCFRQHVSLVWDPQGAHTLTLRDRTHDTDGVLEVKGGTLKLTGAIQMPNVTGLTVGAGATCSLVEATEMPFASGKVALTLAADATLYIATHPITFLSITVDGTVLTPGVYTGADNPNPGHATKLPQVRGTGFLGVSIAPQPSVTASWIGGSGTELTTDANWKGGAAPVFSAGGVLPTFSDADATGFSAVVPEPYALNGLVFSGAGFELSGAANALLTLGGEGIAVQATADQTDARTYRVTAPLAIGTSQTWNMGAATSNTLAVSGGLYAANQPDALLQIEGAGRLNLVGTENADYVGSVVLKNCTANIGGGYPFGKAQPGVTSGVTIRDAFVYFGSCTVDKPLYVSAQSNDNNVQVNTNAEVHLEGVLVHQQATRWQIGAGAKLYLDGGFTKSSTTWQTVWWNDKYHSEIFVRNTPIDFGCGSTYGGVNTAQFILSSGTWHFQVAHNRIHQLYVDAGPVLCEVDWAIDSDQTILQWRKASSGGYVEMNGHPMRTGSFLSSSASAVVKNSSAKAADFYVNQSTSAATVDASLFTSTNSCNLVGNINFCKRGAEELAFSRALAATGTVTVAEGRLVLTKAASWRGASEIVVAADEQTAAGNQPVLEIASGLTFSRKATLTLGGGATVAFYGSTPFVQTVKVMTVDGKAVEPGLYTAAHAPAGVTFVGSAGAILVRNAGMALIVR